MDLEDIILNVPIINALENAEMAEERRRIFHIRDDPFELPDKQFIELFRLSKDAARYVIDLVEPHLTPQTRISAIDPTTKVIILKFITYVRDAYKHKHEKTIFVQVMTALRFFASGSY